jgi:hypothetical protein
MKLIKILSCAFLLTMLNIGSVKAETIQFTNHYPSGAILTGTIEGDIRKDQNNNQHLVNLRNLKAEFIGKQETILFDDISDSDFPTDLNITTGDITLILTNADKSYAALFQSKLYNSSCTYVISQKSKLILEQTASFSPRLNTLTLTEIQP